jgi:hypothetical protein
VPYTGSGGPYILTILMKQPSNLIAGSDCKTIVRSIQRCIINVLIDGGELFPGMQLLEKAAVVTDGTRPCLHHHHQDLVVQRLSDEKEDGGYAVTIESVQRCVEKCSLLIHALVPLQAVGLA